MARQKVLIVDDERSVRGLLAEFVEREGYEVLQADSAENAMTVLSTNRIDAFLLDIDMPGTSGTDLCRRIRATREYEAVPIVFVTTTTTNLEEAFAAGCDDLINKPIDPLILRARLNGHIQRAEYAKLLASTRKMLDHYVSKRTAEVAAAAARTGVLPSPKHTEVVILFTDIRGFTTLSEEMDPDELFSLVSAHLAMQVNLIYEHGGYVDKFGGDGLMAVFDGEDMATQSCLCALKIMQTERTGQLGIGIHKGPVVIGNIGSTEHLDYSVIGNAVNLAARLCDHAPPMSIVVSEKLRDAAMGSQRLRFEAGGQVAIRGLRDSIAVYTLSTAREETLR